jgi:hypothetical protein
MPEMTNALAYYDKDLVKMEQHVFCILIDYRGRHRKGLQFVMQFKSIYNKNLGFVEQKMYF